MIKINIQNETKRALLGLMAFAGAMSMTGCQTTKDFSGAIWGGAKVAAGTVVGATPIVKDAAKAFDKSMADWGNETLESAEKALEKEKFDEIKNNRAKYAPVAQSLAKYCLKKALKDKPLGEGEVAPDPETIPLIEEILNNKQGISRALAGSFLGDKKIALEVFRINFLELSKVIQNEDMIRLMQKLLYSLPQCQTHPLFSLSSEAVGRRAMVNQVASLYGFERWENKTIETAETRVDAIKNYRSKIEQVTKGIH